jgi:5-hydroxyisourate hydrolase
VAGRLTTHVLDLALGRPARGVRVELVRLSPAAQAGVGEGTTNADGRLDAPLLEGDAFAPGLYELVFHAGDYLRATGQPDGFLDTVPIRARLSEAAHYHVPLLLSPFGYSTYRGS